MRRRDSGPSGLAHDHRNWLYLIPESWLTGIVQSAIHEAMYALDHDLAHRRILYSRPLLTLPDILVIDVPPAFAHPSLPLGRFYPILVESGAELREVEDFVTSVRDVPVQPDLLDRRPSRLVCDRIIFAAYAPPESGWPHLLLSHWPAQFVDLASDADVFARGAFTTEMFDTAEQLAHASSRLLAVLGKGCDVAVSIIPPAVNAVGHA